MSHLLRRELGLTSHLDATSDHPRPARLGAFLHERPFPLQAEIDHAFHRTLDIERAMFAP